MVIGDIIENAVDVGAVSVYGTSVGLFAVTVSSPSVLTILFTTSGRDILSAGQLLPLAA